MTFKMLSYLESSLMDTWGITLEEVQGKDNKHSFERGCVAYSLIKKGVPIVEIAEVFKISTGTIYQYKDRIEKEKARIYIAMKNFNLFNL